MSTHLQSLDTPLPGEVPVWVTDHWEFGAPITTGPGIVGGSTALDPLRLATKYDWGGGPTGGAGGEAPDLRYWGNDPTMGEPVYVDTAGNTRARPQVLPDLQSKLASDLPGTYPQGMSIMSLYTATAAAKGWPDGLSCTVITHRRTGDQDTGANVEQWWYQSSATNRRMMVRHGHPGGWAGWRPVLETYENIPNGMNLNDYTNPGYYPQQVKAGAESGSNYPVPLAGMLDVGRSADKYFCWQRYTIYGTGAGTNLTYTRCLNGTNWSSWIYQPKSDLVPANITTAFTAATGWILNNSNLYRVQWNLMACRVYLKRTGANIDVGADGNITNIDVGYYQISSAHPGPLLPSCGLHSGSSGRQIGVLINSKGVLRLVSVGTGDEPLETNHEILITGMFPINPAVTTTPP